MPNLHGIQTGEQSGMVRSLIRLLVVICLGCFLIPGMLNLAGRLQESLKSHAVLLNTGLLICMAVIATAAFYYVLNRLAPLIDANAPEQAQFLDKFNSRYVPIAIIASAALSLFLELAVIRWQSTVLEFFAFYKNYSLLACFVGLGLGYALAARDRIPLLLVIPLLAWQFGFMIIVRFGLGRAETLRTLPFREQLNMGADIGLLSQMV